MALTDRVAFALLADLKSDLGISAATFDSSLERRILAASELIESWCGRSFRYAAGFVERVKGEGWPSITLSKTPVISIASIVLDGSTIPSDAYSLTDADRGRVYRPDGWAWTASLLASASPERVTGTEEAAFVVTYTAGFVLPNDSVQNPAGASPLPSSVVEACLLWAAELHLGRGSRGDVVSEQVGDASIAYAVNSIEERRGGQPPPAVTKLLGPFRRYA